MPRAHSQRLALESEAKNASALAAAVAEGANSSPDTVMIGVARLRAAVEILQILSSTIARTEGIGDI